MDDSASSRGVIIERDEDGVYIATIPALPGVVEQGETENEAYERVSEAGLFTIHSMAERDEEIPPSDAWMSIMSLAEFAA